MNGFSVLRSRLTGNLTTPDDTAGVDAFHSTIQHRPDAVVRAAAEADVVDTVRFAHAGGMPLQLHATGRRTAAPVGTPWAPPGWLARSASPLGPGWPPHVGSPIATCDFEPKSLTTLQGERS